MQNALCRLCQSKQAGNDVGRQSNAKYAWSGSNPLRKGSLEFYFEAKRRETGCTKRRRKLGAVKGAGPAKLGREGLGIFCFVAFFLRGEVEKKGVCKEERDE